MVLMLSCDLQVDLEENANLIPLGSRQADAATAAGGAPGAAAGALATPSATELRWETWIWVRFGVSAIVHHWIVLQHD